MRTTIVLWSLALVLGSNQGVRAADWYVHYVHGRQHEKARRCRAAIKSLEAAIAARPDSATDIRTYGLEFIDYLPYYYLGRCQLQTGAAADAVASFDREESLGAIASRPDLLVDLRLRRDEARASTQRAARQTATRTRVSDLLNQTEELIRAERFEEALRTLELAKKAATELTPESDQDLLVRIGQLSVEGTSRQPQTP